MVKRVLLDDSSILSVPTKSFYQCLSCVTTSCDGLFILSSGTKLMLMAEKIFTTDYMDDMFYTVVAGLAIPLASYKREYHSLVHICVVAYAKAVDGLYSVNLRQHDSKIISGILRDLDGKNVGGAIEGVRDFLGMCRGMAEERGIPHYG